MKLTIVFIADCFQCSDRGCSNCNDASSSGFDTIECIGSFLAESVKLRVHLMFVDIINRNRSEGSQPNVEGEVDQFYAFRFNLLKQFRCEMETSCWCSGRAIFLGIDRLVTVTVFQFFMDIRWQWHLAQAFQNLKEDTIVAKFYDSSTVS